MNIKKTSSTPVNNKNCRDLNKHLVKMVKLDHFCCSKTTGAVDVFHITSLDQVSAIGPIRPCDELNPIKFPPLVWLARLVGNEGPSTFTTLPETNIAHENPIFPGKYHQNGGFSMAMLVSGSVIGILGMKLPSFPTFRASQLES